MTRLIASSLMCVLLGAALLEAQEPPQLILPKLAGVNLDSSNTPPPSPSTDPVKLYRSPTEAALAAFQAAYKSATGPDKRRERAIRLFLLALKRDPKLSKALYNLAVLCAQLSRWEDAINFQNEFQSQADIDPSLVKLSNSELERLRTVARLDSGRKDWDRALAVVLPMTDPIKGLIAAKNLANLDKTRWEAPAQAGLFEAQSKAFAESAKSLDEAASLAPADRRANLRVAADEARREANFGEQLRSADALWEKAQGLKDTAAQAQYAAAAQAYNTAWKTIPARLEPGLKSASGFLMADDIDSAVDVLSRMQASAPGVMNEKVTAMLHELAPVSEKAKAAEGQRPPAPQAEPVVETFVRIRDLVGRLSSSEVELVTKPDPALLEDKTSVVGIPDDEITGGHSDLAIQTSESIFAMYKLDRGAAVLDSPKPVDSPQAGGGVPQKAVDSPRVDLPKLDLPQQVGAMGFVVVQSPTPGKPIYIDGKKSDKVTPSTLKLPAGEHEVGYETDDKVYTVKTVVTDSGMTTVAPGEK